MGNQQSVNRRVNRKLGRELPRGSCCGSDGFEKGVKPFTGCEDRRQFIREVMTILTNNGQHDLRDFDFRFLYTRREDDRLVARIVAEKDGVIQAMVEPDVDGRDKAAAFRALRKHVDVQLDHILRDVPNGFATDEDGAGPNRVASLGEKSVPAEAPPAYGSDEVKATGKW